MEQTCSKKVVAGSSSVLRVQPVKQAARKRCGPRRGRLKDPSTATVGRARTVFWRREPAGQQQRGLDAGAHPAERKWPRAANPVIRPVPRGPGPGPRRCYSRSRRRSAPPGRLFFLTEDLHPGRGEVRWGAQLRGPPGQIKPQRPHGTCTACRAGALTQRGIQRSRTTAPTIDSPGSLRGHARFSAGPDPCVAARSHGSTAGAASSQQHRVADPLTGREAGDS